MTAIRVQRVLQQAGLASRRQGEEWIVAGRVTVNGRKAQLGDTVDPSQDVVALDGKAVIATPKQQIYLALNKPRGYTTSMRDRHAEHLITELLPAKFGRLFPVGRLDRDSEGLILLTNDGYLANALMHPSHGVAKVYEVWVKGIPRRAHLERMRHGIILDDGVAKPDRVELVRREDGRALIRVVLHEGRKRELRRIFDSIGHPVEQLVRTRYGNIAVAGLELGQSRPLTHREVRELRALVEDAPERVKDEHGVGTKVERRGARHSGGETVSSSQSRHSVSHAGRNSRRPHR